MNIMVFNVPAETVGALSILNDFYDEIRGKRDYNINWTFVLSKPKLEETKNIKVLNFPWIKKSWFHRLYFDHIIAPGLVRKYKVDKIMSFQNVIIPHTKVEQILYMHNSLPFVDYKFTFKENKHLWIYQNIIGRNIINSIKKADKIIVQSEWIKKACVEKSDVPKQKINVMPPKVNIAVRNFFPSGKEAFKTFFYPASEFEYKNHNIIVEACKLLEDSGVKDYKVIFTLEGNENDKIFELKKEIDDKKLNINFIGQINRKEVFETYSKSVLLFPSYVESSPLPLTEAALHKSVILASNCKFSKEILMDYDNAYFFNPFNSKELFNLMKRVIESDIKHKKGNTWKFKEQLNIKDFIIRN